MHLLTVLGCGHPECDVDATEQADVGRRIPANLSDGRAARLVGQFVPHRDPELRSGRLNQASDLVVENGNQARSFGGQQLAGDDPFDSRQCAQQHVKFSRWTVLQCLPGSVPDVD